jgi:hypothetical protein
MEYIRVMIERPGKVVLQEKRRREGGRDKRSQQFEGRSDDSFCVALHRTATATRPRHDPIS